MNATDRRIEYRAARAATTAVSIAVVLMAGSMGASAQTVRHIYEVTAEKNVPATMRDGVILRADIYRPDTEGRFPALLRRTPYSKNVPGSIDGFRRLSALGYVVVVQDTRGRYTSDGVASPHDEADDGYDTVEWAASLPYVDGKVGMFGGSYLATTQLMAASRTPPHLTAILPSSSYASRYDMVYQGGAFYLSDGLGWNLGQAADVRRREEGASFEERDGPIGMTPEERQLLQERWLSHIPLLTVPAPDLSRLAPGYRWMLEHPSYDDFWTTFDIGARHAEFETPALHITGWYDTLLPGSLANFAGLRANARTERARSGQRLVIGPWTHSRPTPESTSIGGVDYGLDAGMDYQGELVRWFDYWLKSTGPSPLDVAPVRLFVMGENRWRDEEAWPLARAQPTRVYLHSGGSANTSEGDGVLSFEAPRAETPDHYTYDPLDPVPTGAMAGYSRAPFDPSEIERRADVLVYTSDPLDEELEVTGPIELVLWVASSAPDTDFTGRLIDVFPDGSARTLTDGILRARYRAGMSTPRPMRPGQPTQLTIDLLATSNLFKAGHRIRLEVSSSNFPRFDRNPNTGTPIGTESTLRSAEQTVFHDQARASHLLLPVVPRGR